MDRGPFQREASLRALGSDHFDVVVIGGGITGAGAALDAASRGLRVGLIEQADFASGTSSKSSKLVHGGLRYLQQGDVRLVHEALSERHRLLHNAPHLVHPLAFLIPIFGRDGVVPPRVARVLGTAMWGYDLAGGARIGHLHHRVGREEVLAALPTLRADRVVSGYVYFDATVDDARLTLSIARTAAYSFGASVANGVRAVAFHRDAEGRIDAVEAEAEPIAGGGPPRRLRIRARSFINACGVWSDEVRTLGRETLVPTIRPARGVHICVERRLVPATMATILPVRGDRRSVFVIPRGDVAYIGTTDTDHDGTLDDPRCDARDVRYLLDAINAVTTTELHVEDVVGTWAGLRPLVVGDGRARTADLSRRHRVDVSEDGLVSVTGGKLTTYRAMAADAVDRAVGQIRPATDRTRRRSRTKSLRLRGASGYETFLDTAARTVDLPPGAAVHLADRYGGEARALIAMIRADPDLGRPMADGLAYLRAEVVFAARYEMARSVDDVLSRRTRARIVARRSSASAADDVATLIGPHLGWTAEDAARSVRAYRNACDAERDALFDDDPADRALA